MRLTRTIGPAERDRLLQANLAAARGPARNGDLLRASVRRALDQVASRRGTQVQGDPLIETLDFVAGMLESRSIAYAITGSIATSIHGEPYSSLDVDLVVVASSQQAKALAAALGPRFYAPADVLADAAARAQLANVIDNLTSMKVDFSFIGTDPYLREVISRRVELPIGSHPRKFWFVTPEDAILMKLLWRKKTRSAKQWDNALSVARAKGSRMDWDYLFNQAAALGIEDDLIRLRDESGI